MCYNMDEPEAIMLSEVCQSQKDMCGVSPLK